MKMKSLLKSIEELKSHILDQNIKLQSIEGRLDPLEKLSGIEHRVKVEEIDLSDIKVALDVIKNKDDACSRHCDGSRVLFWGRQSEKRTLSALMS